MKLKRLGAFLLGALMLFATAQAAYDPIDDAKIYFADNTGVTILKSSTALFSKVYVANYDEDGRLVDVNSGELESIGGENIYEYYSYETLGIDTENVKIGSKVMMWSTYTDSIRPASNTFTIEPLYSTIKNYGTAENNPTIIVKKIFSGVDDDGDTIYTVVGQQSGSEVRYTTKANTLVAKMTEPFNGSQYYNAEELWRADLDKGTEFTEVLKEGDIVGVKDSGRIFMIMTDAEELARGVKTGEVPELYNMVNSGRSLARDMFVMGPLSSAEINNDYAFVCACDYNMYIDAARSIDVINVSADGEISLSKETDTVLDLVPFDSETNTGDYVYARYANKGNLQEMYIYRFE